MNVQTAATIAGDLIFQATGERPRVEGVREVHGGCINEAFQLRTNAGAFFVKYNASTHGASILESEDLGLRILAGGPVYVPKVIGRSKQGVLVLEWIVAHEPSDEFLESLGRELAELHLHQRSNRYGLEADNWIGSTPQKNGWCESWVEFWREERLGFQLQLAGDKGLLGSEIIRRSEKLCEDLDTFLTEPKTGGSLLHGDLWSGNFICGPRQRPVLTDPAVYYGHSEAEFGIITLFGGFGSGFYDAYHEILPRVDGFAERVEIYKLYHLLNHLNLFGAGYRNACIDIIRRFT